MTCVPEIVFIDPLVPDVEGIIRGLRPEVEPIVIDRTSSAAQQIAGALHSRSGLAAIHLIAHGSPGRVCFVSGDWSAETLEDGTDHLAVIGKALGPNGALLLWSCRTGAGADGSAFVERMMKAIDAPVAAAATPVGSGALGGTWQLLPLTSRAIQPPLTRAGTSSYGGILASAQITITGTLPHGNTTETVTYFIIEKTRNTVVSQVVLPNAVKQNNSVELTVNVPMAGGSYAIGTFDAGGNFQPCNFLSVNNPAADSRPTGARGP